MKFDYDTVRERDYAYLDFLWDSDKSREEILCILAVVLETKRNFLASYHRCKEKVEYLEREIDRLRGVFE